MSGGPIAAAPRCLLPARLCSRSAPFCLRAMPGPLPSLPELTGPPPPLCRAQAITLAMDRKDREREMVSALLPQLVPGAVSDDQAALGFRRLLAGLDDLALDIPGAARLMELFLGERRVGVGGWGGACIAPGNNGAAAAGLWSPARHVRRRLR